MSAARPDAPISGVWLPIVTPFVDGAVDFVSYERMLEHYLGKGVAGIFPLGTTGESPTIGADEVDAIVERTVTVVAGRVPVFVGVGGNATASVVKTLRRLDRYGIDGIVSVCPYYNRPSQEGMREHFTRIAEATDRKVVIYNIPYRTGVNLANDTLLRLAEIPNIVGVKDSCANLAQSFELLRRRPAGFAVMTGEDGLFYTMLAHGADEDPRRLPSGDRGLRRRGRADGRQRPSGGARHVVPGRDPGAAPVPGGQPHAHQVLPIATGTDQDTGVPSSVDAEPPELAAELDRSIADRS